MDHDIESCKVIVKEEFNRERILKSRFYFKPTFGATMPATRCAPGTSPAAERNWRF
jgi:hypothetical protein